MPGAGLPHSHLRRGDLWPLTSGAEEGSQARHVACRKDKVGVAQTTARILLSGSPLVRAFTVIEKFMSNIFPFPLSLDRIRDTRIKIMTGRGGVVTGRRLPMRKREER